MKALFITLFVVAGILSSLLPLVFYQYDLIKGGFHYTKKDLVKRIDSLFKLYTDTLFFFVGMAAAAIILMVWSKSIVFSLIQIFLMEVTEELYFQIIFEAGVVLNSIYILILLIIINELRLIKSQLKGN
jgi:hypothetical protein